MRAPESRPSLAAETAPENLVRASRFSVVEDADTGQWRRHRILMPAALTLEDRHAAFVVGYELGKAERVDHEIEDQVLARLHDRALEALHMARRYAATKGPAWAAMLDDQEGCGA